MVCVDNVLLSTVQIMCRLSTVQIILMHGLYFINNRVFVFYNFILLPIDYTLFRITTSHGKYILVEKQYHKNLEQVKPTFEQLHNRHYNYIIT